MNDALGMAVIQGLQDLVGIEADVFVIQFQEHFLEVGLTDVLKDLALELVLRCRWS